MTSSYHLCVDCFSQLSFDSEVCTKSATAADFVDTSEMRVVKNILRKDDMITSIYPDLFQVGSLKKLGCHTDKSERKSGEQPERNQRAD